jgi:DNA-directed RNA polymerase subunit L
MGKDTSEGGAKGNAVALMNKLPLPVSKPTAKVSNINNKDGKRLTFTLKGVLPSFANAIRRTILSDIPLIGFVTTPHEESRATIVKNTSRFNNEYLKQRLSCIPIYSGDLKDAKDGRISNTKLVGEYAVELHVKNKTDSMLWVTTNDFRLIDKSSGQAVEHGDKATGEAIENSEKIMEQLFPPFVSVNDTKHYIDIMSLRPFISDSQPGEEIHLTCEFSICLAKKNSCYNVARLITYSNTVDLNLQAKKIAVLKETAKLEGKTKAEIDFDVRNFELLEGKRLFIPNSFEFIVESLGIYKNKVLVQHACSVLADSLNAMLDAMIQSDDAVITVFRNTENTIPNCWDIVLHGEDYTLGTMLQDKLYQNFYPRSNTKVEEIDESAHEVTSLTHMLNFCGFKKEHPHATSSIIRVGFQKEAHSNLEFVQFMFSQVIPQIRDEFLLISKQISK